MNIRINFNTFTFYGREYENHIEIGDKLDGGQTMTANAARALAIRLNAAADLADHMLTVEKEIAACAATIESGHPLKTEAPATTPEI
jgi:hypothetical protein